MVMSEMAMGFGEKERSISRDGACFGFLEALRP